MIGPHSPQSQVHGEIYLYNPSQNWKNESEHAKIQLEALLELKNPSIQTLTALAVVRPACAAGMPLDF